MNLDGSLSDNLRAAIASTKRLQGHRVHSDTLSFWRELLSHARAERRSDATGSGGELDKLIARLQSELSVHEQQG